MTIHQGQLAESQKPAFPAVRSLPGNIEGLLANETVQVPAIRGRTNQLWQLTFQKNFDALLGGAETVIGASSEGRFSVGDSSELLLSKTPPSLMELIYAGAGADIPLTFGMPKELVANQAFEFVGNHQIAFLREEPQMLFPFCNMEGRLVVREPMQARPVVNAESAEMTWLVQNAQELGQYKGEWLLIHRQQLLMHSPEFGRIREEVRQRQIRAPFVYYVPTDQEANSVTI